MKWQMHIQEALGNLLSAKLRSSLALLGILVGTASVVAMVLGGELATNETLKQFKTLGTDLLAVTISNNTNQATLTTKSVLSLQVVKESQKQDSAILSLAPYSQIYLPIQFNGQDLGGTVLGATESFSHIIHIQLFMGRFISDLDHYAYYCVIGDGLYQKIKQQTLSNPIGQQLKVGKIIFTIVGVAAPWPENSFVYCNIDNAVIVPLTTASLLSQYAEINNILFQLTPDVTNSDSIIAHLKNYFSTTLPDKQLYFRSAKELIHKMGKQSEILTVFLGLIGCISLLVGGIGVMNIMLVSVIERRREIGIRLALGAKRTDIRALFLIEALMLACMGGILGVLLGILIAYVIALFWHWEFLFYCLPPAIGFLVSSATGIFFGFYPAFKASRLDPIEALRSE